MFGGAFVSLIAVIVQRWAAKHEIITGRPTHPAGSARCLWCLRQLEPIIQSDCSQWQHCSGAVWYISAQVMYWNLFTVQNSQTLLMTPELWETVSSDLEFCPSSVPLQTDVINHLQVLHKLFSVTWQRDDRKQTNSTARGSSLICGAMVWITCYEKFFIPTFMSTHWSELDQEVFRYDRDMQIHQAPLNWADPWTASIRQDVSTCRNVIQPRRRLNVFSCLHFRVSMKSCWLVKLEQLLLLT